MSEYAFLLDFFNFYFHFFIYQSKCKWRIRGWSGGPCRRRCLGSTSPPHRRTFRYRTSTFSRVGTVPVLGPYLLNLDPDPAYLAESGSGSSLLRFQPGFWSRPRFIMTEFVKVYVDQKPKYDILNYCKGRSALQTCNFFIFPFLKANIDLPGSGSGPLTQLNPDPEHSLMLILLYGTGLDSDSVRSLVLKTGCSL